jgi:hypothetical protein
MPRRAAAGRLISTQQTVSLRDIAKELTNRGIPTARGASKMDSHGGAPGPG